MPVTTDAPLCARLGDKLSRGLYTGWGRWPPLSATLANAFPPSGRPVLIVSLPRSGSSWLGTVLGGAPNALYLREPVSERRRAAGAAHTVVPVDPDRPDPVVRTSSALAFAGVPAFPRGVLPSPNRWALHRRRRGRLVIKEVNPLALTYWVRTYRPLVTLLVRHPAAVALSYRRLGWLGNPDVSMDTGRPESSVWEGCGYRQAHVQSEALHALRDYPDHRVVCYEDLCLDATTTFRDLFAFARLEWDDDVRQAVEARGAGGDRAATFGTRRDSRRMADSWRGELSPDDLGDLRRGYERVELPWYNAPEDWDNAAPPEDV